jgi:hypothetical protein
MCIACPRHEQRAVDLVRRGIRVDGLRDLRDDALPDAAPISEILQETIFVCEDEACAGTREVEPAATMTTAAAAAGNP